MKCSRLTWVLLLLMAALLSPSAGAQEPPDPIAEARRKMDKQARERNYREMREATAELVELTRTLSAEVEKSSEHVISAKIFARADRIEKLAKRVRDKARGFATFTDEPRDR